MNENETTALVRAFDRTYINGKFVTPHGTQVDDLGSMGCDELAVDVGAIKGSYQSGGFVFVHLRLPYDIQQSLPNFAESLWTRLQFHSGRITHGSNQQKTPLLLQNMPNGAICSFAVKVGSA